MLWSLISCGEDGSDGKAFLSYTWDWYVDSYSDNNSDIPGRISESKNYKTSTGRYSYEYSCSDGNGDFWGYSGTYTININKGEEGGLLSSGDDGKDNFYKFNLGGYGANFRLGKVNSKEKKIELTGTLKMDKNNIRKYIGDEEIEIIETSHGEMIITRQKFIIIKDAAFDKLNNYDRLK